MQTQEATMSPLVAVGVEENNSYISLQSQIATQTLSEYDAQIKVYASEQDRINEQKVQCRQAQQDMNTIESGAVKEQDSTGKITGYFIQNNSAEMTAWGDYQKIRESLGGFRDTATMKKDEGGAMLGYVLSPEQLKEFKDFCDAKLQDLNGQSEVKMIYFQSLIDARKQALLQLSNMVSSNHEILLEIIRNMKG